MEAVTSTGMFVFAQAHYFARINVIASERNMACVVYSSIPYCTILRPTPKMEKFRDIPAIIVFSRTLQSGV